MTHRYHIFASDNPLMRFIESDWCGSATTYAGAKKLAEEIWAESSLKFVDVWDFTVVPPKKVLELY